LNNVFILDACALIALLAGEHGAQNVKKLIQDAIEEKIIIKMNQINLLEVYYHLCNIYNQKEADKAIKKLKEFPIEIIVGLDEKVFNEAGRIKSKYKIPLGDSIVVAECIIGNGILVTSDYKDLAKFEKSENIKIEWFR
jgi:predicted nucleic acid-binding protein